MRKKYVISALVVAGIALLVYPRYQGWPTDGMGRAFVCPGMSPIKIGRWTSRYLDGTSKEEFYTFGRLDREVRYYAGGLMKEEVIFEARRVINWHEYWPDGSLKLEGREIGTAKGANWVARGYYADGKLQTRVRYARGRPEEFEQEVFSDDGRLVFHSKDGEVLVSREKGHTNDQPNSPDPTGLAVTPAADAPVAPAIGRGSS